jgi:serine/threonine protein kinase
MSLCFNPNCPQPHNPEAHRFCQGCGARLRLGDRYEAGQRLGTGENSQTFLGRDRRTLVKPHCLIKRFTPSGATALARSAERDRFRQTVTRLDRVSHHPQLPNLLGYFEQGDDQFLVQDYVVGERLDQRLQAWGPLDGTAARQLLTQGLHLLHHLHSHQVIHRDIKPANLLIPPQDSRWWLVDLGAAKPLTATQLAPPGTLIGSAEYAAPEQLRGEATYGSDLYSLGVVCLHSLTGLKPFDLFDGVHGCWRWRSLVPDLAPALAEVLDAMVQPTLADRLPSAAVALQTLNASVSGPPPTTATAVAPPPEPPIWQAAVTLTIDTPLLAATRGGDRLWLLTTAGDLYHQSLGNGRETVPIRSHIPDRGSAIAAHPTQSVLALGTRTGDIWLTTAPVPTADWQGPLQKHQGAIAHLAFYGDDQLLTLDTQGGVGCWHWPSGTCRHHWQMAHRVTALAVDEAGPQMAFGDDQGAVQIWAGGGDSPAARPYRLRTLSGHRGAVSALAWVDQGETLISAAWDMGLWWRRAATGGQLQQVTAAGFHLPVRSLLPIAPNRLITGSQAGQLQGWQVGRIRSIVGDVSLTAIATTSPSTSPIIALLPDPKDPATWLSVSQEGTLVHGAWL